VVNDAVRMLKSMVYRESYTLGAFYTIARVEVKFNTFMLVGEGIARRSPLDMPNKDLAVRIATARAWQAVARLFLADNTGQSLKIAGQVVRSRFQREVLNAYLFPEKKRGEVAV